MNLFRRTASARRLGFLAAAGLVSLFGVIAAAAVPTDPTVAAGAKVFAARCASCHGARGEGTKTYQKTLTGDKSAGELAKYISKSMPPGPKKCTGPDAENVAAYIYETFYSPVAQARNRPARVELSHLTVRQYRNTLTDLIGSFRPIPKWDTNRGLHGEYFKNRRFNRGERVLERTDAEVKFDFGVGAPAPDLDPKQYSVRWEGSIIAPESGDYDIVVRTEQAMRIWVNDLRKPLIDATVKSGSDSEYRAPLTLLGGRAYPLRLEFSKSNQGVNDPAKQKDAPAGISLEWRLPHRTATEVIPQRCLMPVVLPEVFVSTAQFPPDDRSQGYERGTAVSKDWEDATTEGAIETAGYVASHLRELSGVADDAADRKGRLMAFGKQFAERAYRRPLDPDFDKIIQRFFDQSPDVETAVKRAVLLSLKSPRMLYQDLDGSPDAYDVASRLSYGMWDSLPDSELLKAAAANQLSTREQVAEQAKRMVNDPRTHSKVRDFFMLWLKVDLYPELVKDAKKYQGFDPAAAGDLRTSLDLFLESVVWSEKSDFRELMQSDKVWVNGRLAKLYGANLPADAPFQPVALDPNRRAGVLTQPYLLSSFAYLDASSPIHRGVLIARNLLGRILLPPQQAFTPLSADLHPNMTTRERVTLQTSPEGCQRCHGMINPLGFTLENFDAIGRFREQDNGKAVDATGTYQASTGKAVKFTGVKDLANYLADSEEARGAFVEKLFQNLVKQPLRAFGPSAPQELNAAFQAHGCSIRDQVVESVVAAAMKK